MMATRKEDNQNVGKKVDIFDVFDGYGRNSTNARGLAVADTKKSLVCLCEHKAEEAILEAKRVEEAKELALKKELMMLTITAKVYESGRVIGSVTTKDIPESLEKT